MLLLNTFTTRCLSGVSAICRFFYYPAACLNSSVQPPALSYCGHSWRGNDKSNSCLNLYTTLESNFVLFSQNPSGLIPEFAAQETGTGKRALVMICDLGGGSNSAQEVGADPFPVIGWRSAAS